MAIIIIRPWDLVQPIQTSKPYVVEVVDEVALLGLAESIIMRTVPTDSAALGADVEAISLAIEADDSGHVATTTSDAIEFGGGLDEAGYTISASYGAIGGSDALNVGGGMAYANAEITAGYLTYNRDNDALNVGGGLDSAGIEITAGYVTDVEGDALNVGGGVASIGIVLDDPNFDDPNFDDFTTNTLTNYTEYADAAANWAISGGYLTASSGSQSILTRNGTSFADGEISAVILEAHDTGLVLRLLNNSTYYVAVIYDASAPFSSNNVNLYSRVGGSYTLLASSAVPTFNRGTATTLSFSAIGSSLVVKVNGTTYISATNSSISSAGLCGVRMNAAGAHKFDSFTVTTGYSSVTLMAHMNVASTPSVIDDTKGAVFSGVGGYAIVTDSNALGGKALEINSGYVQTPYNSKWAFPDDFTVELRVFITSHDNYGGIIGCAGSNNSPWFGWQILFNMTTNYLLVEFNSTAVIISNTPLTLSAYQTIALTRSGSTVSLFINGTLVGTGTYSGTLDSVSYPLVIGVERTLALYANGNYDEVRITKHLARYTSNYTPLAFEFPDS